MITFEWSLTRIQFVNELVPLAGTSIVFDLEVIACWFFCSEAGTVGVISLPW